ncbi:MAG TPA: phosphatidate cytidylyltransferase [Acidobacteriaceae bacterium]|jgi:phosphatidate cytidylyltransferase|nr:phosphatidate cytidylyltransferase [Acidobacteriaceae bacterium]
MKRILTAVILIPLVLLLILEAPYWLQVMAAGVVAEFALYEYLSLADASGTKVPRWLVLACGAVLFAVVYWAPGFLLSALGMFVLLLLGLCTLLSPLHRVLTDASFSVFGLMYIAYPLALAPLLITQENGTALLLFLLIVVWAGDITALYTGRAFGKHAMSPTLSPQKTWEGAIGSLVGSVLAGLGIMYLGGILYQRGFVALMYPQRWWYWIMMAMLLNIAAQIGDLLESALKRGAGVKDSGAILPGHGGVLDRVDALLLALPVLWYVLLFQQSYFM